MATSGYESEEDLPPFPVQDYSPTGYPTTVGMQAQETHKNNKSLSSSSSILTNKNQPQSLVKRLANKYLGIKAKFSSAPNIPNTIGPELEAKTNYNLKKSNTSNTVLIGNSKFFDFMQKKDDEVGEIVCNDEFDTVSLGRMSTLDRNTTVNRSNRSCPGFKTSLPNIAENGELSDSRDSQDSIEIIELDNENNNKCDKKDCKPTEAINPIRKLSIFEPRDKDNTNPRKSNASAESDVVVNECYEPYEFEKSKDESLDKVDLKPKPPPRPMIPVRKNSSETSIYENLTDVKTTPPKPAARTHIPLKENAIKVSYENVIVPKTQLRKAPEPPERSILVLPSAPSKEDIDSIATDKSSHSISRSSTVSSESLTDEADFEDILLSKKSMSFRHSKVLSESNDCNKTQIHRTQSTASAYSDVTEASAMDNVDVSGEVDDKSMYLSMTGTLPSKKAERAVKKKVLFRHKTFTNIELDGNSINKDFPRWNNEFKKETLANYHIRGTGHCIYKAPTVQEFIYIFNRDTLYSDVAPFEKVPNKRESYFETAICFCKPEPPKFHKSAEDLLELPIKAEEKVTIDIDALRKSKEMQSTSFQCFCDEEDCKFHEKKRESSMFVIKFSAIKKSISTPDITLVPSPTSTVNKPLIKNNSVPYNLEEPYAVVDIVSKTDNTCDSMPKDTCVANDYSAMNSISQPSTISSSSRPYSIRDIAEEISMNSANSSLSSNASDVINFLRQSSSDHSGRWSLHTCNSNATVKSDMSFKSCLEDVDSSDDETLHSEEDVSDTDTVASVAKRPWVHSDSFRFGSNDTKLEEGDVIAEESTESGIETCSEMSPREGLGVSLASLERGSGVVRSGSGRRRWDEAEATSEGDALSVSSAASSCAPHHLAHHHDYNKVSPTPPKKPPRRNLSVSPTHANSPSSGYSYEIRPHARSQDDLDDIQGAKHYLKHGRSVDQYVDGKLSYSEYEENHNSPRVAPIPNPRPSLKNRPQPVAITAMYENVVIKEQNPRRKLRRNNVPQYDNFEPRMTDNRVRKYSAQEKSSLESLLDDSQSMNSPSDCERYYEGPRVEIPLSPSHYDQPPTPDHPPPSARQAENSIHERIRPLSQRIMEVIEEIRIRKKTEAGFSENSRS